MTPTISGPCAMLASPAGAVVAQSGGSNKFQKTIKGIVAGELCWGGNVVVVGDDHKKWLTLVCLDV